MAYTRRTSKSTGKGSRTTTTRTITNSGSTKNTTSRSTGTKTKRMTSSTNLSSGERTKHYVTTNMGGWRKTTLLNPVSKTLKTKKPRKLKVQKSKPIKFSTVLIILCTLYLIGVIVS